LRSAFDRSEIAAAIASHDRWFHQIELAPGIVTPGIDKSAENLRLIDLPADLRGLRVLDLGARDGFFSFECERRGADVIAIDYLPAAATGFAIAAKILGSGVRYEQANIYHVTPERFGHFDLVLMLGLLYHLRDPLGAIDLVRNVCSDRLILESHVCDDDFVLPNGKKTRLASVRPGLSNVPIMQFCPGSSLNADHSNYWAPNTACIEAMLREASFDVRKTKRAGNRSIVDAVVTSDAGALYQRDIARGDVFPAAG
jgi:tRNA (mo5U34)-methyltransferase